MKSVLIVDDNLVNLKQISVQLTENYDVLLAKSGESALKISAQERPDLILLDVEMPGMDGFETIARFKANYELKDIPVIFLTGNDDSATEIRCLESGAVDFITKPANVDILRHRIELHIQFSSYQLHLEHMVKELEDNISISFAEIVECKDFNIAGHVLRTGLGSELLAQELYDNKVFDGELQFEDIGMIRRAAPFHDIGKIGISDVILLKQGPLNKEEYKEIRRHPLIGAEVLRRIYERTPNQQYLQMAMVIAEGHHENYNGSGYPHGLAGDAIPLCCRILSVVNVYDACITDRVYRKGMKHEQACEIIRNGRGTEFDAKIVDIFDKITDKFALLNDSLQIDQEWSLFHEANSNS